MQGRHECHPSVASSLSRRRWRRRRRALAAAHLNLVHHLTTASVRFGDTLSFFLVRFAGDCSREFDLVAAFFHRDARKLWLLLNLRLDTPSCSAGRTLALRSLLYLGRLLRLCLRHLL